MDLFICIHTILPYLVRRGIQCSAAILPSMPTLANWSQNWSLSSSCSSLISSSSREATPLAVWCYFNKIRSNQLMLHLLKLITTTLFYVNLGFSSRVFCTDTQQACAKLDTDEVKRGVNMTLYCFEISISQTYQQNQLLAYLLPFPTVLSSQKIHC